jgi:hypothetical protein
MTKYADLPGAQRLILDATKDSQFGAMMRAILMGADQPVEQGRARFVGLPSVTKEDDGEQFVMWTFVRKDGTKIFAAFTGFTLDGLKEDMCGVCAHIGLNPNTPGGAAEANAFFKRVAEQINVYHGPARSLQKEVRGILKRKMEAHDDGITDWKSGTEEPAAVQRGDAILPPGPGGSGESELPGQ